MVDSQKAAGTEMPTPRPDSGSLNIIAASGAAVAPAGRNAQGGGEIARRTGSAFVRADVRDRDAVDSSVREAVEILGGLDAFVLNAGVLHEAPLSETPDAAWGAGMGAKPLRAGPHSG